MELVTGDLKVLENETKLLMDQLCRNLNLSEVVAVVSSLDVLLELYYDVTGSINKRLEKYKKNKYLYNQAIKKQKIQANQFIENFIKNKEFHNFVMNDLLYEMNDKIDYLESIESKVILSDQEMYDIMREFLEKKNMDRYLDDVVKNQRIFYGNSSEFYVGYMAYNVVSEIPHILINKDMDSVEFMTAIVHEVGHIKDYDELFNISDFKTVNDYYMKSIYTEVVSKQNEKEFLDFLIKNRIASKDACCMIEDYYLDITSHLGDLLILTNLDDPLLKGEKYRHLSNKEIIEKVVGKDTIEWIDEDYFIPQELDLFRSLSYGYGGVLATYFESLKKNDPDRYRYCYQNFLRQRADWFSVENFVSFVPDCQNLSDIVTKEMDKDIKVKQKIYHEN